MVNPYTRNPALLAMAAATLDRLSGGRLVLGLGRSESAVIQDKMGIRYGKAGAAMEGAVSLLNRLLAGQRVSATAGPFSLANASCRPSRFGKRRFIWPLSAARVWAWPALLPTGWCSTPMYRPAMWAMRSKKSGVPRVPQAATGRD